jgi:large subunit ribosomal protein L4
MAQVTLKNAAGKDAGTVDLDDATFGIQPNVPVMHQVVTAQLAARRAGTQSTKTRAEVRGGGAKPYRQKGTGNARQGSNRSPQFSGGGVALGPKPRKYNQKTPKKMISLALRSALSDRAGEGKIVVVDSWGWDKPSTKAAVKALAGLGIEGRALVVVGRDDAAAALSFRNLPAVQLIAPGELNAYDVLCNEWIVFTQDLLPTFEGSVKRAAVIDEDAEITEEIEADEEAVEAEATVESIEPDTADTEVEVEDEIAEDAADDEAVEVEVEDEDEDEDES